jgi:hypothetical protein
MRTLIVVLGIAIIIVSLGMPESSPLAAAVLGTSPDCPSSYLITFSVIDSEFHFESVHIDHRKDGNANDLSSYSNIRALIGPA